MKHTGKTVLAGLVMAAGLAGCDPMVLNKGDAVSSNVAGTWSYVDTSGGRSTWILTQDSDDSVDGTGTASDTITGYVNGDYVQFTVTYSSNLTSSVSGTVSEEAMAGTFTNSTSGGGAWTAYRTD